MKQIVTIIDDCRNCPNYCFSMQYEGGTVFRCEESEKMEERLIPWSPGKEDWLFIHEDCSLENKE